MRILSRPVAVAAFLLATFSFPAHATVADTTAPTVTPLAAGEVVLGERALEKFLASRPQTEDGNLAFRVSQLGTKLARFSDRPDVIYSFLVVKGNELQAYSFAGGAVCLTEGLARLYESDDELAFTIAHELAHVALRHTASETVFEAALAAGGSTDREAERSFYGRASETDADRYGALYACRAGYKVTAAVEALERLARATPGRGEDRRHPAYADRIEVLQKTRGQLDHAVEAFQRGKTALAEARSGDAVSMFTLFAATFPKSVAGQVNLGSAFLARARTAGNRAVEPEEVVPFLPEPGVAVRGSSAATDLSQARARFEKALELSPDEPEASLGLAVTLLRLGELAAAREPLGRLIARPGPQPDAMLCLGNVELRAGDPGLAAARYRSALEMRPGWSAATKNLALAEEAAGNRARARELWESLRDDPALGAVARERLESFPNRSSEEEPK